MENFPQRKSPRLSGYDYSQSGVYFVTICTFQREHLFGEVVNGEMRLSALGELAHHRWTDQPNHFPDLELDVFVVMPNHIHGLMVLHNPPSVETKRTRQALSLPEKRVESGSLSAIVGSYKSSVTRIANQTMGIAVPRIWQGRFHDHMVRSEQTFNTLREYILYNPERWEADTFYPSHSAR